MKYILIVLAVLLSLNLFSQENSVSPEVKESKAPAGSGESGEKEKETINSQEEKPAEEGSTFSGKKNSLEFRPGVFSSERDLHPMMGFLYERSLTGNWNIGLSLQPALLTAEVRGGSIISESRAKVAIIPIDFTVSYHFREGASFRPFIRGYIGPAIFHMNIAKKSHNETLLHAGLGAGFRYYFSESFFAVTEISANYFAYKEMHNKNPGGDLFGSVGLGFSY